MINDKRLMLVTGATGNIGRRLVSQLIGAGARVRALTRNPDSAGLLARWTSCARTCPSPVPWTDASTGSRPFSCFGAMQRPIWPVPS